MGSGFRIRKFREFGVLIEGIQFLIKGKRLSKPLLRGISKRSIGHNN